MTRAGVALLIVLAMVPVALAQAIPDRPPDRMPPAEVDSADAMAPLPDPYTPSPALEALRAFRLERSVDVERVAFGAPDDPLEIPGLQTLADHLRLRPSMRTRELSQGPTQESFEFRGSGSTTSELLLRGSSLREPGTSGPQSNEVVMSELAGYSLVRGGASALYGPNAVGGAMVLDAAQPMPETLQVRIAAEEGSDDYLRAGFHVEKRFGQYWSAFMDTETRFIEGFLPGTKESDRYLAASAVTQLPSGTEAVLSWRHFQGDGRHNGFDPAEIKSVLTERDDLRIDFFRGWGEDRGLLAELQYSAMSVHNYIPSTQEERRIYQTPLARLTTDLPSLGGLHLVARGEGQRKRVTFETTGEVVTSWIGAGALRGTIGDGPTRLSATGRGDFATDRAPVWQGRVEGEVRWGRLGVFAIGTHGERWPDRGAELSDTSERRLSGELGTAWHGESLRARLVAWGSKIRGLRPDPTFEQIRARDPVLGAPVGDGEIAGATFGFDTNRFVIGGADWLGHWLFDTNVTWMSAENTTTGTRLSGRPRFTWTGHGLLERTFFQGELLARVRGRLTYWHDRIDDEGQAVEDLWLTDVLLEAEIGDAALFVRFIDMLESADPVEPGIPFPGFSRTYGLTWRFRG